jgi:hypothetical protein
MAAILDRLLHKSGQDIRGRNYRLQDPERLFKWEDSTRQEAPRSQWRSKIWASRGGGFQRPSPGLPRKRTCSPVGVRVP